MELSPTSGKRRDEKGESRGDGPGSWPGGGVEGKENVLLRDERFGRPTPGLRRGCDGTEAGGKEGPPLL